MRRVLIDHDFDASGIWLITSPGPDVRSPYGADGSRWSGSKIGGFKGVRPWSNLLSSSLLDELKCWNEQGCVLARSPSDNWPTGSGWDSFYQAARDLASRTQLELGAQSQVLWAEGGAWNYVRSPW